MKLVGARLTSSQESQSLDRIDAVRIVLYCEWIRTRDFRISWPIWVNFSIVDLHVVLLSNHECHEYRYRDNPYLAEICKLNGALFSTYLDNIQ
jgi:hypothetical protein